MIAATALLAATGGPWTEVFGRLHILVLHLPIGLWAGIGLLEFGAALLRRPAPRGAVLALAILAGASGALAATCGWVLAFENCFPAARVDPHRWFGVATAATGLLAAVFAGLQNRKPFRFLLLLTLGLLVPAGHLGGELTHDKDYLLAPLRRDAAPAATDGRGTARGNAANTPPTSRLPQRGDAPAPDPGATPTPVPPPGGRTPGARSRAPDPAPAEEPAFYATAVAPVLERTCTPCHGADKQKSRLRLDSPEAIAKGGKKGKVLVPGKPEESPLLARVLLPLDDDEHMPPVSDDDHDDAKNPQPTAAEIDTLRRWVAAGAPFTGPLPGAAAPAGSGRGDVVVPAPAPDLPSPAAAEALAALRAAGLRAEPVAEGSPLLVVDAVGAVATLDDDAAARLLAPVRDNVRELLLARTRAGDAVLAACARMPRLSRLDLRATKVTDAGLQGLGPAPALAALVLAETAVTDAAIPALQALPALRRVYLWHSAITADGIARLRGNRELTVDDGEPEGTGRR